MRVNGLAFRRLGRPESTSSKSSKMTQVCWLDTETGESGEQMLVQARGDAEWFYRQVPAPALIGMEATGNCHWLVDL